MILYDVLFVPDFKFNLFSVSSFIEDTQFSIILFCDYFLIQDFSNQQTIGKGNQIANLYVLDVSPSAVTLSANVVSAHIWHTRLGHLYMKTLEGLHHVLPCDTFRTSKHVPCYICHLAKQKRLPFISNHHIKIPF